MTSLKYSFGLSLLLTLFGASAFGQVQRSFVSGGGNDGNPCSRSAPCRTFGQAISQTSAGGEVVVLDSAGYGPVTITKSVSLIAPPGVYAGISVFSGDGIDINAGGSDAVILRGLTVNNQGSAGSGVVLNSGLKLHMEGCVISGFSSGQGLLLNAGGGALAEVIDSIVRGNSEGIRVQPPSGTAQVTIDHVRLEENAASGLIVRDGSQVTVSNSVAASNNVGLQTAVGSGSAQINVESTAVSGNAASGINAVLGLTGTGAVQINVARCVISGNGGSGIRAQSLSTGVATVRVSRSTVTGNGTGLRNVGAPAVVLSRVDNTVEGNTTDTAGTIGTYSSK